MTVVYLDAFLVLNFVVNYLLLACAGKLDGEPVGRGRTALAAALGAFCGILVIGFAEYTWFYPRNMFIYWFLVGVIMACVKLSRMPRREEN